MQAARWTVTSYRVLLAEEAAEDLLRIEDFTIERELASATPDLDVVRRLRDAVDRALRLLEFSPYSCRKAARALNDNQRELIVPFGNAGLVAAFEVRGCPHRRDPPSA